MMMVTFHRENLFFKNCKTTTVIINILRISNRNKTLVQTLSVTNCPKNGKSIAPFEPSVHRGTARHIEDGMEYGRYRLLSQLTAIDNFSRAFVLHEDEQV